LSDDGKRRATREAILSTFNFEVTMTQSAVEAKIANIAKMGEPLGEMYSALWQEVATIHFHWKEYVELFGVNSERIALLNDVASFFFRMIQDGQWETSLLHLTRLTDPAVARVRKEEKTNLTVRAVPELIGDANLKANVDKLVRDAVEATGFARDWRDRRIAHRDLKLALEQPTTALAEGSRADVKKALEALAAVLNALAHHYLKTETRFDLDATRGGAASLLHVLEIGMGERRATQKRLEEAIQTNEDLTAKKSLRRNMILATITMLCEFAVWALTPCIWLFTVYLAYLTSFRALLAALFLPFLAQLYWIWVLWIETGTILNVFTFLCFAWVAVAMVGIVTRMKLEIG
jgi:hypothetical protein